MSKFRTIEQAKDALKELNYECKVKKAKINPKLLGDETYLQIPSGYSFVVNGVTYEIDHQVKGCKATMVELREKVKTELKPKPKTRIKPKTQDK